MTSNIRPARSNGEPGSPYPDASWMTAFAERLLELQPESTPLDAVRVAMNRFEAGVLLGPANAAEAYAKASNADHIGFEGARPGANLGRWHA